MTDPAPRTARLQAIRDRWFAEPLTAKFSPLDEDPAPPPATCDQFVRSGRLGAAFSSLHEGHEALGISAAEALARDWAANAQHFGVEDPRALMGQLSEQFNRAPGGQVEPEVLKKGFVVLDVVQSDSVELAASQAAPGPDGEAKPDAAVLQASYLADAESAGQALNRVGELAGEFGISLPLSRGAGRKK